MVGSLIMHLFRISPRAEALEIVKDCPELAVSEGCTILQVLAHLLYDGYEGFVDEENQAIQLLRNIWENIVKLPAGKIDEMLRGPADQIMKDKYPSRVLFVAAEMGNTAFILELIRHGVYSLLHEIGPIKASIINLEDEGGNNMLHLVGIPKKKDTSSQFADIEGPILQMRHELQWSKVHRSLTISLPIDDVNDNSFLKQLCPTPVKKVHEEQVHLYDMLHVRHITICASVAWPLCVYGDFHDPS
ncbi:hypothetical protein L1887_23877 [Cichorium endivia]|nr:hypothetical protein L1887_23877 [Cichorium endivia]